MSRAKLQLGLLSVGLLMGVEGCQTDHRRNCEDLCETLIRCDAERVCDHIAESDIKACRRGCKDEGSTFDIECIACLADAFSCENQMPEDCEEPCRHTDFTEYPHQEWFCDGEPLVSGN